MLEADHWIYSSTDHPDFGCILNPPAKPKAARMTAPAPISFLTAFSAESLISGLQHKKIAPSVLHHINLLLDEVLVSLVTAAESINPRHLRAEGIPVVFSSGGSHESTGIKSLSRECTGEAELELRAWYELSGGSKKGFPPGTNGRGMTATREAQNARFPLQQAIELLRLRVSELSSTSSPLDDYDGIEANVMAAWTKAGGDPSQYTIEPAAAWMHAFIERIQEHLCSQLNRVVERDSSSAYCGPNDLYTALAEDERFWGWFSRMQVKSSLNDAIKAASKAPRVAGLYTDPTGRLAASGGPSEQLFRGEGPDGDFDSSRFKQTAGGGIESPVRASTEASRLANIASVSRKTSSMSKRFGIGHDRKDSNLSVNTRAGEERARTPFEDQDDFDALVRSGETMKVSLTPSRLRTFDESGPHGWLARKRSQSGSPQNPTFERRGSGEPVMSKSQSGNVALSSLSPPRAAPTKKGALTRSRASSLNRPSPRPATTIEETQEEDDTPPSSAGRAQPRETLKDILSSAPAEFASPPSGPRTAPAVILGGPPPGATMKPSRTNDNLSETPGRETQTYGTYSTDTPALDQQKSSANSTSASNTPFSINRDVPPRTPRDPTISRSRRNGDSGEDGKPRKTRSEAQELADFFNTPPPDASPAVQPVAASSTKSGKGFRGLMSKVTGSGRRKEEEARLARENALYEIPNTPARSAPRKQRSMASFATARTSKTAPPSAYKQFDEAPPALPSKLRKQSEAGQSQASSGITVAQEGSSDSIERQFISLAGNENTPPDQSTLDDPSVSVSGRPVDQDHAPSSLSNEVPAEVEGAGRAIEEEKSSIPMIPATRLSQQVGDENPSTPPRSSSMVQAITNTASVPFTLAPVISASSVSSRGHAERTPSDAYSFQTADEGEVTPVHPGGAKQELSRPAQSNTDHGPAATEAIARSVTPQSPAIPSVPISRLLPMRTILQHATSADECRMLVNAYLSQIGVPVDPQTRQMELNAEAKVMAWLLDHEAGPPLALPWSPPASGSSKVDRTTSVLGHVSNGVDERAFVASAGRNAETEEPPLEQRDAHSVSAGEAKSPGVNGDKRTSRDSRKKDVFDEEEEILSDGASVASLSQDEEGVPVSYAASATRSSPVRLSPMGQTAA